VLAACQAQTDDETVITLRNSNGVQADIMALGAIIHRLLVPDVYGIADDVVLGFDDPETYRVCCSSSTCSRLVMS
jgi:aldose 1-epimerase